MSILNSLLLIYFLSQTSMNPTKSERIVTKLIPKDSINSPFYNPKHDQADRIIKTSRARINHLQGTKDISNSTIDTTYVAEMYISNHGFFVNLSIGDPPVQQLVVMDTGSSLMWVQCKPCKLCYNQTTPIYDSSFSSSHASLPCEHFNCNDIPNRSCNILGDCMYQISYMDHTSSKGQIGTEKFTFSTQDDGIEALNDIVFGCGHENHISTDELASGIIGLGFSSTSIVNKFGLRFSYCIGNVHDPNYLFNQLNLGDDAIMEGYSTELDIINGIYYLSLEGISLGEERLEIDSNVFKRELDEGGTIIDSGNELTLINEVAFRVIREKIESILNGFLSKYGLLMYEYDTQLCYQGKIHRDLAGFPTVTFHFGGGADLVLDIDSLFYEVNNDAFCLALMPSSSHSIIGILAQQYYNVGYDLAGKKIFFQRIDCEVLSNANTF